MLAVQARKLRGEFHGIAMAPAGPEPALATVIAEMRTAAGELHDHRALAAPVAVAGVIDQLPSDAVGVEIADDRCRRRRGRNAVATIGDAGNARERPVAFERGDELRRRGF